MDSYLHPVTVAGNGLNIPSVSLPLFSYGEGGASDTCERRPLVPWRFFGFVSSSYPDAFVHVGCHRGDHTGHGWLHGADRYRQHDLEEEHTPEWKLLVIDHLATVSTTFDLSQDTHRLLQGCHGLRERGIAASEDGRAARTKSLDNIVVAHELCSHLKL